MLKKIYLIAIWGAVNLFLLNAPVFAQGASNVNVCAVLQCVKIQNGNLWVLSSDNSTYVPYFIKAVGYEPTPIGRYPSDWGYATTDPRSANNNIYDDPNILNRDFSLLQRMNANTVRIWQGNDIQVNCECTNNGRNTSYITNASNTINTNTSQNTLDIAASYGLKVIAGFALNPLTFDANNNIGSTDSNGNPLTRQQIINNFVSYVNTFKGNRAILFWAIGNEMNYEQFTEAPVSIYTFESLIGVTNGSTIFNWLQQTANFVDDDGAVIVNPNTSSVQSALQAEMTTIGDNNATDYTNVLDALIASYGASLTPQQLAAWYSLVDAMAQAAHHAEGITFHPVTVVNGGIAEIGNSADGATDAQLPDLDVWGVNEYIGQSFGSLFSTYASKSSKPLWISEFGVDAWNVTNATGVNDWGLTLGSDLGGTGYNDPTDQSTWDGDLWNEILNNSPVTIGGSVMEYSDEWWKPNEFYCSSVYNGQYYNNITNGICNSNQKYFGFPDGSATPDGFSNEEWYGVVSIGPNPTAGSPDTVTPRAVYSNLQTLWQSNPWPSVTLNITGSGTGNLSSPASLGAGLNCNYAAGSSTGNCSAAVTKGQSVTLTFSSNNGSTVTNWGTSACAGGNNICTITPDTAVTLNVTITPESSAPTVSLSAVSSSATAPGTVTLTATASASTNATVSSVAFYNGSTLLGTATSSPYTYTWSNVAAGTYSLTAVVTDSTTATATSSTVPVTIGAGVVPTVSLGLFVYSYIQPGSVFLSATASETNGTISKVEFYSGSTLIYTSTSTFFGNYDYVWNNLTPGNYSLTAKAYDSNNNSALSAPVTITIGATELSLATPGTGNALVTSASSGGLGLTNTSSIPGNSGSTINSYIAQGVNVLPDISTSPDSQTVIAPAPATFEVAASGTPAPSYQWQISTNGGAFTNISGATGTAYTTGATTVEESGTQYECVVTNPAGAVTSNPATLTVVK